MTPLLAQFLSEARDFLQGIGEKLMQLEKAPDDAQLMTELFRLVHTLKGNSGLFDFPEMTRVLHAGEDLMDAVRNRRTAYSKELADRLLDAMDFVGLLCDEIEGSERIGARHAEDAVRLAQALRALIVDAGAGATAAQAPPAVLEAEAQADKLPLAQIPEAARMAAYRRASQGDTLHWLTYSPAAECFYQGDDPFFQARQTPDLFWGGMAAREPWPKLAELDAYRCVLDFHLLTGAPREDLDELYRYMPDQLRKEVVPPLELIIPHGEPNGGPVYEDFVVEAHRLLRADDRDGLRRAAQTMLELSSPELWLSSALRWLLLVLEVEPENASVLSMLMDSLRDLQTPDWSAAADAAAAVATPEGVSPPAQAVRALTSQEAAALAALVATQKEILALPVKENWQLGRLRAVAATLAACLRMRSMHEALPELESATAQALDEASAAPLHDWLLRRFADVAPTEPAPPPSPAIVALPVATALEPAAAVPTEGEPRFGRRAEDAIAGPKRLKVDQAKIDRLMNLIGEMVVSKNALPYLAARAEAVFGVRELSREIKAQYAVINRIAEEMQDAIMQVRMMPVSFVFQRFPRLVRDTARKLDKEVNLLLLGEDTEADKNIIEALADPLVHIVRNSLDHGIESPEVRRAAGKPAMGTITLRASQESDRVAIEIIDDGKGIDPAVVKRKAYEKGIIDEAQLARISDEEAVNLVFASGLSTTDAISDLSGRGVGMDVVRTAVEKVNGTVVLSSEKGRGTRIRLSLPLSMAVTNVMIVESDGQIFGMPMDCVVETVRVPRAEIHTIKHAQATVLRGRIVPLKPLNALLQIAAAPKLNAEDEYAVLVVRVGDEVLGLIVDGFRETVDIILKPMAGVLSGLGAYSGSALMGDGSVLMVLNIKEML